MMGHMGLSSLIMSFPTFKSIEILMCTTCWNINFFMMASNKCK